MPVRRTTALALALLLTGPTAGSALAADTAPTGSTAAADLSIPSLFDSEPIARLRDLENPTMTINNAGDTFIIDRSDSPTMPSQLHIVRRNGTVQRDANPQLLVGAHVLTRDEAGNIFVAGRSGVDFNVRVQKLDAKSGNDDGIVFRGAGRWFSDFAVSTDGTILFGEMGDRRPPGFICRAKKGDGQKFMTVGHGNNDHFWLAPDSTLYVGSLNGVGRIGDDETFTEVFRTGDDDILTSLSGLPDGRLVFGRFRGDGAHEIDLFDPTTGEHTPWMTTGTSTARLETRPGTSEVIVLVDGAVYATTPPARSGDASAELTSG